jgi:rfaE bifunctional protein nucleotidyltransferase chain/domain
MTPEAKICLPQDLAARLAQLPRPFVMTNGVFDVLHRGHVNYLHQASDLGSSLIVAINTDSSARMLGKGPDRPLNHDMDRAFVLAGLSSVSLVTFFDQLTPVDLIREVRPDIYVKGGDYNIEMLQETRVVRSWGGKAVAIPFVDGFSTTRLVHRIRQPMLRKAAFLDRDGVINRDKGYVYRWEDFEFMPGAVDGMRRLQNAGYQLVIVTNQSGIARGFYSEQQYQQLSAFLLDKLADLGVKISGIFHCPHHPEGSVPAYAIDCDCRKPAPGMIARAARELGLSLLDSMLIGDKDSDITAARAAGVGRAYLVASDNPESSSKLLNADGHFANLLECAEQLFPLNK